jgi:hypothetical protein
MPGVEFDDGPEPQWMDIEDAFTRAYQRGYYPEEYMGFIGEKGKEVEVLPIYLRQQPYNLLVGRPHYPETAQGVSFFIQITAAPERLDIERELYAALEGETRLWIFQKEELRRVSKRTTERILKMIREGHIIPKDEFTKETPG